MFVPTTYKQTQGSCLYWEAKKHGLNERTDQNSRKGTKQKGGKQSDSEFKTLVLRMLKESSEDLSSIKKIQSDMKDSLIEI